jgi:hypothetical protein
MFEKKLISVEQNQYFGVLQIDYYFLFVNQLNKFSVKKMRSSIGEIVFFIFSVCFLLLSIDSWTVLVAETRFNLNQSEHWFIKFSNICGCVALFLVCIFEVYYNIILCFGRTLKDNSVNLLKLAKVAFVFHHFISFLLITMIRELLDAFSQTSQTIILFIFWGLAISFAFYGWRVEFSKSERLKLVDYFGTVKFVQQTPDFKAVIPTILGILLQIIFSAYIALSSSSENLTSRACYILIGNLLGLVLNAVQGPLNTFCGNGVEIFTLWCYLQAEHLLIQQRSFQ